MKSFLSVLISIAIAWDEEFKSSDNFQVFINQNGISGEVFINKTSQILDFSLNGCANYPNKCSFNITKLRIYSNPHPLTGYWKALNDHCDPLLLGSLKYIIEDTENPDIPIDFTKPIPYTDVREVQELRTLVLSNHNDNHFVCAPILLASQNYILKRNFDQFYLTTLVKSETASTFAINVNPSSQTTQTTIALKSYEGTECSGEPQDSLIFDSSIVDYWHRVNFRPTVLSILIGQKCISLENKGFFKSEPVRARTDELDFSIQQHSPFHPTEYKLSFEKNDSPYTDYKIHNYYVDPSDSKCFSTGNPYDAGMKLKQKGYFERSHEDFHIGDLSSRHGSLRGMKQIDQKFVDHNLPLFGINTVEGRSIVFYNEDGMLSSCYNLTSDIPYYTYESHLHNPSTLSKSKFVFRQAIGDNTNPTFLTVKSSSQGESWPAESEMGYGRQHSYGIHLWKSNDCAYVGGHFRDASEPCENGERRCEIGDLSTKYKPIPSFNNSTLHFTDLLLPMKGKLGIEGRSVVIYANMSGEMYMCAEVLQSKNISVKFAFSIFLIVFSLFL